jgi:hypothetical protein
VRRSITDPLSGTQPDFRNFADYRFSGGATLPTIFPDRLEIRVQDRLQ